MPGVTQQTVVTPNNGLTVLVGTGGPHQTIHHLPHGFDYSKFIPGGQGVQYPIYSDIGSNEIDNYTKPDNEQRGDIPGHIIMPGQIIHGGATNDSKKIPAGTYILATTVNFTAV